MQHKAESSEGSTDGFSTSPYNPVRCAGGGSVMLFDTTLRDGEQAPGIALSPDDKVRIAMALDDLGVDIIEAGFAASSQREAEAIRTISSELRSANVCSLARSLPSDVDAVLHSGADHIHIFIATSPLHMRCKLGMDEEGVRASAVSAVEYACDHGLKVHFSCEDATRSDPRFLISVYESAVEAGASSVNIADTVGIIVPSGIAKMVSDVRAAVDVPVSVHCHDDLGLAVANTVAAVEAGAGMCHVTVNGIGERAGNAALEEVAMYLRMNHGIRTVELSKLGSVSKLVERATGFPVAYNKSIIGRNAFAHESGIHVHGVMKDSLTYEPFRPEIVGVTRNIVIGKHSGTHSVRGRLEELGIDFPEDRMSELIEEIKGIAVGGKEIDDAELLAIADHVVWKGSVPQHAVLGGISVLTGKDITSTATVTIIIGGEKRTHAEAGVGPVDAALRAIAKTVNDNITLESYKLAAVTGGSDAVCEATVMVRNVQNDGHYSVGRAVGVDVVLTSVEAMMSAINRDFARGGATDEIDDRDRLPGRGHRGRHSICGATR